MPEKNTEESDATTTTTTMKGESTTTPHHYDIFRDSPLRYLGYANEVGESFRYQVPKLVVPSYVVAIAYCLGDAATTGYDTYTTTCDEESSSNHNNTNRRRNLHTALDAADTLIWQGLASVMIPGATINLIVKATKQLILPSSSSTLIKQWLPTAIGLASIPLIIHPIDQAVDTLLDNTTRPYIKDWKTKL